jgi:hypothetical protein
MSLKDMAPTLCRSLDTLKRYASTGKYGIEPPDVVIERLKALVRYKAFEALGAADCSVRYQDHERTTDALVTYEDFRYDPEDDDYPFRDDEEGDDEADSSPVAVAAQPPAPAPRPRPDFPPGFRRPAFLLRAEEKARREADAGLLGGQITAQ